MKKGDKFVLLSLAFVALMILAVMGYRILTDNYTPQGTVPSQIDKPGSSFDSDATPAVAPDFTVLDMNGKEVNLSDFFGKPIIINFWATWCGPCQSEMDAFNTMYARYGEDIEFIMLNLTDGSRDTVDKVKQFTDNMGYSFPVYFDTTLQAAQTYGAYSIPMTFCIDDNGIPVHTQTGAMSEEALEQLIHALIDYCDTNEPTE